MDMNSQERDGRMKLRNFATAGLLLLGQRLTLVVLSACEAEQPPARSPSSPQSVLRAPIYVSTGKGPEASRLAERLSVALSQAGYEVVSSDSNDHTLTAEVSVTLRENHSLLQVRVNGKVKQKFVAEATLHVNGTGQILSGERIEYNLDDGPSDQNMRSLLLAIRSPAVQEYLQQLRLAQRADIAREQKQAHDQELAKQKEQFKAKQEQQHQDDAAWNQVVSSECTTPTQLTGCDSVKVYLAQFPNGLHVTEAKKALEAGVPIIAQLTDARDWATSRAESCKSPRVSSDCEGISSYLQAQPAGAHAADARELLARAEPKLTALRKAEEKQTKEAEAKSERDTERATQAQERDDKRKAREHCKKECIGGLCFSVRPGAFEVCVDRCVQANCDSD